ncbi:unnamed protein product [Rotaria socialis]|uniref:Uncharacterized protein n=1 Tax=Rotaria socialis TaxID=392032 RepID=A0A821BT05_9BILA|nr:unnamed protein product [Rotaria socialis]
MWTCSITTKTKTTELISNAHTIVRARVIGYENPPAEPNHRYMGIPESVIKFEIEEQIKGAEILPNILWVNGYLSNNDDYNDHPPPYRRVRPNGRTGSCIANTYKQGAEYLLFLNDRYSPYWDALTPVNEQLHSPSSEDRWLRWSAYNKRYDNVTEMPNENTTDRKLVRTNQIAAYLNKAEAIEILPAID